MSSQEPKTSSSTTTSTPLSAIAARRERQRLAAQTASTLDSGSSTKASTPSAKQNNAASPVNGNQSQSGGSKKKKANKNKKLFLSSDDSPSQFIPLDNNNYSGNNPFSISFSKSKPKVSQKSRQKPTTESREEEIDSSQDEDQDQDPKSARFSTASQSLNSIFKANPTPKSKSKESDPLNSDKRNRGGICSTFIPTFNHDEKTSRQRNVVRLSSSRTSNDMKGKGKQKEEEEQEGLVLGMMKEEVSRLDSIALKFQKAHRAFQESRESHSSRLCLFRAHLRSDQNGEYARWSRKE